METSTLEAQPASPGWGMPLVLAALIFCVYSFLSSCSSIWDRDEARFARATAEMVSTGNYLYPTFNGKLRPDKPILIYWLMSMPVRMFGQSEWAFRFCSVLGTALACLFTYFIGRRLFSHRAGLWGMALLAANPLMAYTGAVATSDAVLLAFITGAFAVFADALKRGFRGRHAVAMAFFFAGGVLTKGPVALLPLIPFLATQVILRRELGKVWPVIWKLAVCAVAAGAAFAAWFYPANQATSGELYALQVGHHLIDRLHKPLENHGGYSPFYLCFYALVIAATFFPWTLYLPGALVRLYREKSGEQKGRVLLMTWILSFFLIMIAISTKLPHYILPIWPALALCVGAFLDDTAREDARSPGAWWTFAGGLLFLGVALTVAAGIGFGPEYIAQYAKNPDPLWKPYADESRSLRSVLGALCLIVSIPIIFRHKLAHFAGNARILLGTAALFALLSGTLLLPSFEHMEQGHTVKISKNLADPIKSYIAGGAPVTLCGYNEASLIFYLNANVEDIIPEKPETRPADGQAPAPRAPAPNAPKIIEQAVINWANKSGPGVLIIPRPMFEKFKTNTAFPQLLQLTEVNGYNYSKGKWVDVLALRRQN